MTEKILNVLNGDCAIGSIKYGENLVWRENYLNGPVPKGENNALFRHKRATVLSAICNLELTAVEKELEFSTMKLLNFAADPDAVIVLHNDGCLYDQLLYIMVIKTLFDFEDLAAEIVMKNRDLPPVSLSDDDLECGASAVGSFTGSDPRGMLVFTMAHPADVAFPYLNDALKRLLKELPLEKSGLSESQLRLLESIRQHPGIHWNDLYHHVKSFEQYPHLTDLDFAALVKYSFPLISYPDQQFRLSDLGEKVLQMDADFMQYAAESRFIGGVEIAPERPRFRRRNSQKIEIFEAKYD